MLNKKMMQEKKNSNFNFMALVSDIAKQVSSSTE